MSNIDKDGNAHTPTPWYLETTSSGLWIGVEKATGGKVGDVIVSLDVGEEYNPWHNELAAANAAFIVHCVNLHEELVGALERIRDLDDVSANSEAINIAHEALEKLK
jgi:hypothetical protein